MDDAEHLLELLVAGGEAAELLRLADEPLDLVAVPIGSLVEGPGVGAVGVVGDHRHDVLIDARAALLVPAERRCRRRVPPSPSPARASGAAAAPAAGRRPPARAAPPRPGPYSCRPPSAELSCSARPGCGLRPAPVPSGPRRSSFSSAARRPRGRAPARPSSRSAPAAPRPAPGGRSATRRAVADCRRRPTGAGGCTPRRERPNSEGRSRHGTPVRAQYSTASKNIRSGRSAFCPPLFRFASPASGSGIDHSSSVSRYRIALGLHRRVRRSMQHSAPQHN